MACSFVGISGNSFTVVSFNIYLCEAAVSNPNSRWLSKCKVQFYLPGELDIFAQTQSEAKLLKKVFEYLVGLTRSGICLSCGFLFTLAAALQKLILIKNIIIDSCISSCSNSQNFTTQSFLQCLPTLNTYLNNLKIYVRGSHKTEQIIQMCLIQMSLFNLQ